MRLRTKYTERLPTACGLVLDIQGFEGSGSVVHDLSGKGNEGAITLATWGKSTKGVCLNFDDNGAYINCGNDESLNVENSITVESFVHLQDQLTAGRIVDKVYNGSYACYIANTEILGAALSLTGGNVDWYDSSVSVALNEWLHVAMNYKSSDHTLRLYNGGVEKDTKSTMSGTINSNATNLYIGNRIDLARYFKGLLQSLRIYKIALSEKNLKRRYEQSDHDYCRGS